MPEGDTIYRAAEGVRPVLVGQPLLAASSSGRTTVAPIDAGSLVGRTVTGVTPRGKHLLIDADDGRVIHSHLGMTGSWHVYSRGEAWRKPATQAALVLQTERHAVVCFSPKLLRLVSHSRLRRDGYLARLGPDLMRAESNLGAALARLRVHHLAPIGEAVMNQTLVAGIGNVYKSETLFLARINPWTRVGELTDDTLLDYLTETRHLMRANRGRGRRVTRRGTVGGVRHGGGRHWVYGRSGRPCYKCGGTIELRRQGDAGRTTYWCPACQPPL